MDLDQILPRLYVGESPELVDDIDILRDKHRITAVLCLQTDEDFHNLHLDWAPLEARYAEREMALCRIPVRDFDGDDLRLHLPECVEELAKLLRAGHTVYLHCNLGVGRSPSVAIAYLHWIEGCPLDEAAERVYRIRSVSPNLKAIRLATQDRRGRTGAGSDKS